MSSRTEPTRNQVIKLDYTPHTGQTLFHKSKARFRICCVPPNTIIPGDYKRALDIDVGDRVIGHDGNLQNVLNKYIVEDAHELIKIKARYALPLSVTGEHPIWVTRVIRNDNYYAYKNGRRGKKTEWRIKEGSWVESRNIDYYIKKQNKYEKYCLLIPYLKPSIDVIGWGLKRHRSKYKQTNFPLNIDTVWACGMYIAEGNANNSILYTLGLDEYDYAVRLYNIFKGIGYNPKITFHEKCIRVSVCSIALAELFREKFGTYAENKRIPDDLLLHENNDLCRSLIRGYMDGDGCFEPSKRRLTAKTNSEILASQMQLLIARFRVFTCLYTINRDENESEFKSRFNAYCISITNRKFMKYL